MESGTGVSRQRVALLSAYDKNGIESFARQLADRGWLILASAGTAKYLNELPTQIAAEDVSKFVGKPILGHRVVTIDRKLHAALLATESAEDEAELAATGFPRIDLVYVNLYPLKEEIEKEDATLQSVIEKTDVGGPLLLRAASKGRRYVVTRSKDLPVVLDHLSSHFFTPSGRPRDQLLHDQFISSLVSIAENVCSEYSAASSAFHQKFAAESMGLFSRKDLR